jgi:hypothetical protein
MLHALDLPALIEALSRPEAYAHPVDAVEVHQTHISAVFLAGPFAYKIKKPVNLGSLDFSTLEKRAHFCAEEVRLNRRLAPQIYLGVIPVSPLPTGGEGPGVSGYRLGGTGVVVEWEPIRPAWLHCTHVLDTSGPIEQNKERLQALLRQEGLI